MATAPPPDDESIKLKANDSYKRDTFNNYTDVVPVILIVIGTMGGVRSRQHYTALCDSGSTYSWIKKATVMNKPTRRAPRVVNNTLCGKLESSHAVDCHECCLVDFSTSKRVGPLTFRVFETEIKYDIILGRDSLSSIGIQLDFEGQQVIWQGDASPMLSVDDLARMGPRPHQLRDALYIRFINAEAAAEAEALITEIAEAKYQKVDTDEVAANATHLEEDQREDLARLLRQFPKLFSGKLGKYPGELVHIEVPPEAKPVHKRHYSVPKVHEQTFKAELDRLVKLGVLEPTGPSAWAAPTFIIPKKDKTVRFVSDFRALNKVIKRKEYPIPRIHELLARRKGYQYFTKLDVSMQFYTFELDESSSALCTIATPFGLYRYKRLPMGICQAPDIAQEAMDRVLRDIDDVEKYLDDVGCFSDDWNSHINLLHTVLQRLEDNGFTINPTKCEWGIKETDWLGYWLTPVGLKPYSKKVQAIRDMEAPKTLKQLRSFLGLVTYYRNMWRRRAHILAPLTALIGTDKFIWTDEHQKAFEEMKAVAASDVLLRYPDHNKIFIIETDASDYQLGAVILQDGVPVAYFSRKLTAAQQNYTTIEKELLSIVETLKTFRSMLLGARIEIHTDHKNLTHELTAFQTQRVLRWRLYIEEYGPQFFYRPGELNPVADALSRVPTTRSTPLVGEGAAEEETSPRDPDGSYSIMDDPELVECLLLHPEFDEQGSYPLNFETIQQLQAQDERLVQAANNVDNKLIRYEQLGDAQLIVYDDTNKGLPKEGENKNDTDQELLKEVENDTDADRQWLICIPDQALDRLVQWYHQSLSHAGITKMVATIRRHFVHPELRKKVEEIVKTCDACQKYKAGGRGYGELPEKEPPRVPWHEVHLDLIGPWVIKVNGTEYVFKALTMIDPVTNLLEISRYEIKQANSIGQLFENNWICRYPRPLRAVFDRGTEFQGAFKSYLIKNGIKGIPTSVKNPTANGICERVHQTIGNVLRTLLHTTTPQDERQANELIDKSLATAMRATRCIAHTSLGDISPGALVFQRDMFLDIPIIADIMTITKHRESLINNALIRANKGRWSYDYEVDQLVLRKIPDPNKLEPRWEGPYKIMQVHTNGTVTIRLTPTSTERLNIRRVKPYRTPRSGRQV
jgi:hypothetical protein